MKNEVIKEVKRRNINLEITGNVDKHGNEVLFIDDVIEVLTAYLNVLKLTETTVTGKKPKIKWKLKEFKYCPEEKKINMWP